MHSFVKSLHLIEYICDLSLALSSRQEQGRDTTNSVLKKKSPGKKTSEKLVLKSNHLGYYESFISNLIFSSLFFKMISSLWVIENKN